MKRRKKRGEACLKCGTHQNITGHHIYPKRHFGRGWRNAETKPLCRRCHDRLELHIPYSPKLERLAYLAIFYTFLEGGFDG